MIPKIIHYCWLSDDPVPSDLQKYMRTWKEKLPDYEFMKWDFNRFDKQSSKWVAQAFDNKKYAFAADYIRLYALYNYGGIYLDMDVEVLKSYNPFLCLNTMLGWQNGNDGFEVAAFGVEQGTCWVAKALAYYKDRDFVRPDGSFDTTTLPKIIEAQFKYQNLSLMDVKSVEEALRAEENGFILIFPSYVFSPKEFYDNKVNCTKETVSIHQFAASWMPMSYRIKRRIEHLMGDKLITCYRLIKQYIKR